MSRNYRINKAIKLRRLAFLDGLKVGRGCADCGLVPERPAELHFHHRDPADKRGEVGRMVRDHRGWPTVLAEIEKCDVLCGPCHRARHAAEHAAAAPATIPPQSLGRRSDGHRAIDH